MRQNAVEVARPVDPATRSKALLREAVRVFVAA
jgi:hypothetical protein